MLGGRGGWHSHISILIRKGGRGPVRLSLNSPVHSLWFWSSWFLNTAKKKDWCICFRSSVHRKRIFNQGIALIYCIAVYMLYVLYVVFFWKRSICCCPSDDYGRHTCKDKPRWQNNKNKKTTATLFISILGEDRILYTWWLLVRFILCGWNCDSKYGELERNPLNVTSVEITLKLYLQCNWKIFIYLKMLKIK